MAGAADDAFIPWDIKNKADRDRYFWPREAVIAWWQSAQTEGWCRTVPESHGADDIWAPRPRIKADQDLEEALDQWRGDPGPGYSAWWTPCGVDDSGKTLYWDPFHLPFFHPLAEEGEGRFTGKHPQADRAWPDEVRDAFKAALWARMQMGREPDAPYYRERGRIGLAPCQGFVVPSDMDLSLDDDQDADDPAANPALWVDFDRALFGRHFMIRRRQFGMRGQDPDNTRLCALFTSAQFSGHAGFESAQFSGTAWFNSAQFSGDARFGSAQFSGTAVFDSAQFSGTAWFTRAQFSGDAGFDSAQFSGDAGFARAQFSGDARFARAQFSGTAGFARAQFSGDAGFHSAQFSGTAYFTAPLILAKPAAGEADPHIIPSGSFRNAVFERDAIFVNRIFRSGVSFERARFHARAQFQGADLHPDMSFHQTRFLTFRGQEPELPEKWRDRPLWVWRYHRPGKQADFCEAMDSRTNALERDYRTLKLKMEDIRARTKESEFFGYEMRTRLNRTDVPLLERCFLWLYGLSSAYGQSVSRSMTMWLGWQAIWFAVNSLFASIHHPAFTVSWSQAGAVFQFLVQQTTRPFGVWTGAYQRFPVEYAKPYLPTFLPDGERLPAAIEGVWLTLQLLASTQSLGVLVLTFVFLVVLRRRFQMN